MASIIKCDDYIKRHAYVLELLKDLEYVGILLVFMAKEYGMSTGFRKADETTSGKFEYVILHPDFMDEDGQPIELVFTSNHFGENRGLEELGPRMNYISEKEKCDMINSLITKFIESKKQPVQEKSYEQSLDQYVEIKSVDYDNSAPCRFSQERVSAIYLERGLIVQLIALIALQMGYRVGIREGTQDSDFPVLVIVFPNCLEIAWHFKTEDLKRDKSGQFIFPMIPIKFLGYSTAEKLRRISDFIMNMSA